MADSVCLEQGTGSIKTLPLIMGSNRDEGAMFIGGLATNATKTQFEKYVVGWADEATLHAIERLYPASLYPYATKEATAQWWAMNRAWGDMYMRCPVRRAASYMSSYVRAH
jgi:carboxylesterase type B